MRIVTHNGHFHTDDLMAVSALLLKYPEAEVVRSRDEKIIESADIAVDVGQIYDPAKLRFDHHQTSGAGDRPNGIPYASFGLVWKEFGEEIAGGKEEAKVIEEKMIMSIDAKDNGFDIYEPLFSNIDAYTIGDYFESFTEGAKTTEDLDEAFFTTLMLARDLLKREINIAKSTVADWREVRKIYNESENKQIIVLTDSLHWKRVLIPTEAKYVIFPRSDGQWTSRAVPNAVHSFDPKKRFPLSWSGLSGEALRKISSVESAVFCHRDCHLAVAQTKEGAIKLAEIALES